MNSAHLLCLVMNCCVNRQAATYSCIWAHKAIFGRVYLSYHLSKGKHCNTRKSLKATKLYALTNSHTYIKRIFVYVEYMYLTCYVLHKCALLSWHFIHSPGTNQMASLSKLFTSIFSLLLPQRLFPCLISYIWCIWFIHTTTIENANLFSLIRHEVPRGMEKICSTRSYATYNLQC